MRIITINPGSTSTKFAVFEDTDPVFTKTIRHSVDELSEYKIIFDQYEFRKKIIVEALKEAGYDTDSIDAVVGRGGMLKPIASGIYRVNRPMIEDLKVGVMGEHASNLGGVLAREVAMETPNPDNAFIVDPVVVDELDEIARYSGRPDMPRVSIFHALNQKAVARRYSREIGTRYDLLKLIVVHLGGGITIGVHKNGRVIDVNNGLDGDGPFSPERSGSLPSGSLVRTCFSGKFQLHHVKKMITGNGGLVAYLGTNDASEIEQRIKKGDHKAKMIYRAMAYQIAKDIGAASAVLYGDVDAILVTGGLARSDMIIKWIKERVNFIGPVKVFPGEDELQALAENAFFALKGDLPIKEYM